MQRTTDSRRHGVFAPARSEGPGDPAATKGVGKSSDMPCRTPLGGVQYVSTNESEEGARHAQEIIDTPGVGAIWAVHVSDEDSARILKMCKEKGVIALTEADPEDVEAKVDAGYQMILVGWDFRLLERELRETVQKMRSVLK